LLGGVGVISGANVTVNPGGGLVPGSPLGTLTVSNNLTLAAGSTAFMRLQHAPLTNSSVRVSGTITENGTLNVTNSDGSTFAAGEHFTLFNAAAYTGGFASYVLPSLPTNLRWNTSLLNIDGSLWVLSTTSPLMTQVSVAANNLVVSGTGGTPNWNYYVLASTNVAPPMLQWTRVATNSFDSSGGFTFTNSINPAMPRMFLKLQVQ